MNTLEFPSELTGTPARIIVLLGKYFPTGSHKVGATFGPLVERLVTGRFDPVTQKAIWPSTGNYCRGGAYDSHLLACQSIAILPEEMSRERFDWLREIGAEVVATPGCESNVKEIYDRAAVIMAERGDGVVNLNQFAEFGNPLWHYAVTGPAMEDVFRREGGARSSLSAVFLNQGSAGTLGCCEYLREKFPLMKVCAGEALQCPTLLLNGYGGHRIEGIGDKHVPWILNLRNLDVVAGIDDEATIRLMRLFNEPEGRAVLTAHGISRELLDRLDLLGISGIANLIGAIKTAKYFEMTEKDVILTVATDSMELYGSRVAEERERLGAYSGRAAEVDFEARLRGIDTEWLMELSYRDKRRMHNLKYFTWIEQQGRSVEELDAQWYDPDYWTSRWGAAERWDRLIEQFNERTGVLKKYL